MYLYCYLIYLTQQDSHLKERPFLFLFLLPRHLPVTRLSGLVDMWQLTFTMQMLLEENLTGRDQKQRGD